MAQHQTLAEQSQYWQAACTNLNMEVETVQLDQDSDRAIIEQERQKLMLELLSVEQSLVCLQGKNKTMISTLDSKQKLTSDQKRQIESRQSQIDSVT